jgi:hypothetical protein
MSGIEGPTSGAFAGIVGGAAATAGGLAIAQRVMTNGPTLRGNVVPALLIGGMVGMSAACMSNIFGDSLMSDTATVGGFAAAGGVMMMGRGSLGAARGAAIMGVAALGGVALARLTD